MQKRTTVDFKKHELFIIKDEHALIHYLKKPNTMTQNIKYINCGGILAVTGDYGNWIFYREFHPSPDGYVSDMYWCEKLQIASTQDPYEFDKEATRISLQEQIDNADEYGNDDKAIEYFKECILNIEDAEFLYDAYAYGEMPGNMIAEDVIKEKRVKYWLKVIFDGFDEMCMRLKEKNMGDL